MFEFRVMQEKPSTRIASSERATFNEQRCGRALIGPSLRETLQIMERREARTCAIVDPPIGRDLCFLLLYILSSSRSKSSGLALERSQRPALPVQQCPLKIFFFLLPNVLVVVPVCGASNFRLSVVSGTATPGQNREK
jgi:hypothetical protein